MWKAVVRSSLLALVAAPAAFATSPALAAEDLRVAALDPGIQLHLRHKYPVAGVHNMARKIVLFVHGATFPASSTFDVPMPSLSWMDELALDGADVYALDIRGYGGSTRPPAMSQPPEDNPPFARAAEAVRDITAAVEFILAKRQAKQLTLIGWSWGTTTTAAYASRHPQNLAALVLISPVWLGVQPPKYHGAYRTSTRESARAFAIAGIPKDRVDDIAPLSSFDAWWAATLATDPQGGNLSPPVVRSPNGVLQDFEEFWAAGRKPAYDAGSIEAPTLLLVGEWDVITPPSMAQALYAQLTHASERRLIEFSEATHFMIIEKHRDRVLHEVQNFLGHER